jgi:predicted AAA+ superfamily ATPase
MLPYPRNPKFYGRQIELKKINQALSWRIPENDLLRAYTIYGRRGVGKTEIALEYAYLNPEKFDAIFWVNCETSLSLRESFTSIAKAVNIPGADKSGTSIFSCIIACN